MGFFSPPSASSSSRHRHHGGGGSSSRHRSGGHPSSSSSRHSGSSSNGSSSHGAGAGGGSSSSSSNPRKKVRTAGDGSAVDGALASGPDANGLYAGYDPSAGDYYYDYDESSGAGGYYAAEGSNNNQGYYDFYGGTHPSSATTTPEEDAAASAAAAAAAAAAAGDNYYTSSVSSAVADHVYEAGLQFHGFQRSPPTSPTNSNSAGIGSLNSRSSKLYALPNDETEKNRDDMKHSMALLLMQNRLFYSPVDSKLKAGGMVYDLGTGTGIWAMDRKFFLSSLRSHFLSFLASLVFLFSLAPLGR